MDIDKLIKIATLERNDAAKEAYRAIKTDLLLNHCSKNPKPEGKDLLLVSIKDGNSMFNVYINELDLSIIRRLISEREEQVSMYETNNRKDLADIYREQIKYLEEFLPSEISEDVIQEYIATSYPNGYTKKEMGKIIKEVRGVYPTADGRVISETVKKYIL